MLAFWRSEENVDRAWIKKVARHDVSRPISVEIACRHAERERTCTVVRATRELAPSLAIAKDEWCVACLSHYRMESALKSPSAILSTAFDREEYAGNVT
jgi:hypothetical protein